MIRVCDIPNRKAANYDNWVRQSALYAASRVTASLVHPNMAPTVTAGCLAALTAASETYLRTGRFPTPDR